jgi:hypothetical protein
MGGDVIGYVYQADTFCPDHIVEQIDGEAAVQDFAGSVESKLDYIATMFGIDRDEESSFDSGDFPKVILKFTGEENICGACGEAL